MHEVITAIAMFTAYALDTEAACAAAEDHRIDPTLSDQEVEWTYRYYWTCIVSATFPVYLQPPSRPWADDAIDVERTWDRYDPLPLRPRVG